MKVKTVFGTLKVTQHKADPTKLYVTTRTPGLLEKAREVAPALEPTADRGEGACYRYSAAIAKADSAQLLGGLAGTINYTSFSKAETVEHLKKQAEALRAAIAEAEAAAVSTARSTPEGQPAANEAAEAEALAAEAAQQ